MRVHHHVILGPIAGDTHTLSAVAPPVVIADFFNYSHILESITTKHSTPLQLAHLQRHSSSHGSSFSNLEGFVRRSQGVLRFYSIFLVRHFISPTISDRSKVYLAFWKDCLV
jgi:uncharacterized membrane protein